MSILLATRNRLPYLRLALESARAQTLADIEIVVSDDGSTDGTQAYVAGVASADERVRLLTDNPTPGVFENFSHLLAHAMAYLVAFLGDDDLLAPTFAADLLAGFADPHVVVSYAYFDIIDSSGTHMNQALRQVTHFYGYDKTPGGVQSDTAYVALRGQLWLGACLYRTDLVRELGLNHERFTSAADWDLALRLAERGSAYFVPRKLWSYRDHGGANSRKRVVANRRAAIEVLSARFYKEPGLEALRKAMVRRELLLIATWEATRDPAAAHDALARYRAEKGGRRSPRFLVVALALGLPAPLRRQLIQGISRLRSRRMGRVGEAFRSDRSDDEPMVEVGRRPNSGENRLHSNSTGDSDVHI